MEAPRIERARICEPFGCDTSEFLKSAEDNASTRVMIENRLRNPSASSNGLDDVDLLQKGALDAAAGFEASSS